MSNLSTLPKGDSAWLLRKAIERIIDQVSVLETNIGVSTSGNSADTQIIFNDAGTLRGDAGLVYNKTTDALTVAGLVTAGSAAITGDLTVRTTGLTVNSSGVGVGVTASLGAGIIQIGAGKYLGYSATAYMTPEDNVQGARIKANNILVDATSESKFNIGGTLAMTLNSTGLGVGVSPGVGFDLQQTSPMARVTSTSTTGYSSLSLRNTGASGRAYGITVGGSGTGTNAGNLVITDDTASATRFVLDSSGNVGIGVTPSAWGSGYKALQFGQSASVSGFSSELAVFGSNCYFDTTDSRWERITAGYSSQYYQTTGTHVWRIAGTAGANTDCTFTQAMTLDASGRFYVGTTSSGGVNGFSVVPDPSTPTCVLNGSATTGGTAYLLYSTGATSNRFYVTYAGTVFATNTTISAISDARFKENVQDIDVGLGAILALKPRKFDWKAGKGKDIKGDRGFIAQEFETVFPNLIDEWADPAPEGEAPYKSVRQDLIPVLVKAIQELTARVQTLETR